MASAKDSSQPIIVIRRRKRTNEPHHGGAWKVAYADFVTAMMAFFLLLWLLSVTTSSQRQGIADYFTPVSVSRQTSGSGGLLGGITITTPGALVTQSSAIVIQEIPSEGRPGFASEAVDEAAEPTNPTGGARGQLSGLGREGQQEGSGRTGTEGGSGRLGDEEGRGVRFAAVPAENQPPPRDAVGGNATIEPNSAALERRRPGQETQGETVSVDRETLARIQAEQREQAEFQAVVTQLQRTLDSTEELQQVQQNLVIDQTPEGLRIQIVDREGQSMFRAGSAQMLPQTRQLLTLVAQAVQALPNRLAVSGHTDSIPYGRGAFYDNWDLSTDRAHASRRALVASGVADNRIATVVGRADREHLFPEEPNSPRNRRVSIVILRERALGTQAGTDAGNAAASVAAGQSARPTVAN